MKASRIPGSLVILFFAVSFAQNPQQSPAPPGMIFELLALNKDIPTAARPKYLSPCALTASPDGSYLYVAEQTAKQIGVVDLATQSLIKNIKLPSEPTGIAVAQDGAKKIYVTCSSELWPQGMVCEVDVNAGAVVRRIPAGFGARSPVITHNGKTLFVCNQFENTVSSINLATGKENTKLPSARQPYAAAITRDDSVLVVANLLPTETSMDTLKIASKILLIDAFAGKVRDTISLPVGSHSAMGVAVSPDGNYAFVTHQIAMFIIPGTLIEGGWIHTNNCAIVDINKRKILNVVPLDMHSSGDADPWGIACSPDGRVLSIAHSGSNELSLFNLQRLIPIAANSPYSPDLITDTGTYQTLSRNFTLITSEVRRRVPIHGKGPRAMCIVDSTAYTAGYFGDFIEFFPWEFYNSPNDFQVVQPTGIIALGPSLPLTAERKGEQAFFDATLCYQKWQTCHSCHPFGRADGYNFITKMDTPNFPNVKGLTYSWWTPPTDWEGNRPG
jgi:YVTN family beta-propeller protein